MMRLFYFVKKECLLLSRDLHGLLLLFVMPSIFILIMTFALQNQFSSEGKINIDYYLINQNSGQDSSPNSDTLSTELVESLEQISGFNRISHTGNEADLRTLVAQDEGKFLIIINNEFEQKLAAGQTALQLEVAPGTKPVVALLIQSQLDSILARFYLQKNLTPLFEQTGQGQINLNDPNKTKDLLTVRSLYNGDGALPSSVQQNVPGWLLFAMFFISIPLSNTLIHERQQGTLARLKTMGFPNHIILLGKLIPYFLINLLQVVLMLLIGVYLIPALGGERLALGSSVAALTLLSASASLAAVAYALLIAQLANTTEQATILSGVCNILMAAIGGVMVPRFIMPPAMQELSAFSPMAWGLDGFFDIFLHNGGVGDVLNESAALLIFGLCMLLLATIISNRRTT